MKDLEDQRKKLDNLDASILELLEERMRIVDDVAKIKDLHQMPLEDAEREKIVLEQIVQKTKHPLLKEQVSDIFKILIECAKRNRLFKRDEKLPFKKIGIVGLGLIGGSLVKALKIKQPSIQLYALARGDVDDEEAKKSGLIDVAVPTLKELCEQVDIVILCSPLTTIVSLAKQMAGMDLKRKNKLLVMDVASVKREIVDAFETLTNDSIEYVATHPMAGSEKSGFENSYSTLFFGASWIITPHAKNSEEAISSIEKMIKLLGANTLKMDGSLHDKQTALISHLPGIISKAVHAFALKADPKSLQIAGPGFKSITRLAHSNPRMRSEIAYANRMIIRRYFDEWLSFLQENGSEGYH